MSKYVLDALYEHWLQNQRDGHPALAFSQIPESVLPLSERNTHDVKGDRQKRHTVDEVDSVPADAQIVIVANDCQPPSDVQSVTFTPSQTSPPPPPSSPNIEDDEDDESIEMDIYIPDASQQASVYQLFTGLWAESHQLSQTSNTTYSETTTVNQSNSDQEINSGVSLPTTLIVPSAPINSPQIAVSSAPSGESKVTSSAPKALPQVAPARMLRSLIRPLAPLQLGVDDVMQSVSKSQCSTATDPSTTIQQNEPDTQCQVSSGPRARLPSPLTALRVTSTTREPDTQFVSPGVPLVRTTRSRTVIPSKARVPTLVSTAATESAQSTQKARPKPRAKFQQPKQKKVIKHNITDTSLANDPYNLSKTR